jgi:DNA polymerase-3 subunit delta'
MWSIIGQEHSVEMLKRGLAKGSPAHAYLFVGPPHVGKTTLAVNLAQALNCEAEERPCGVCSSCQRIASGKHADVQAILLAEGESENEAKTKISVDQIEQLQHSSNLPPFEGKHKVFIIDQVETFSIGAANRLLKTLEEPPPRVVFILLTSDEPRIPATIISRCQRIELIPTPASKMESALVKEKGCDPEKAKLLSRLSHGCPGWAIVAASNDAVIQQRNELLEELLTIIGADYDTRFDYVAHWTGKQSIPDRLSLWLDWWRDLLLVKTGNVNSVINIDRISWLTDLARNLTLSQLRNMIAAIQNAAVQLRQNANPQLVLEVLMLKMPEPRKTAKSN